MSWGEEDLSFDIIQEIVSVGECDSGNERTG
jgi:hypothetical protein